MQIENISRGTCLVNQVRIANTWRARLVGWIGVKTPLPGQGLHLIPCQGVHTFGLRFPIDAIYLDKEGIVLGIYTLCPGRLGPFIWACSSIVEVPANTCQSHACAVGDKLRLVP